MPSSLNVIGPHKLIRSGIIRKCSFVGVGNAFLELVCHCGFGVSYVQVIASVSVHFLLPADQDVELSAPCLPEHMSHHDDNGLNF